MRQKAVYSILLLTLPTLVVAAVVLTLMSCRIPTRVQLDITADRALFVLGGTNSTSILNTVKFQSLTVEKFSQITLNPKKIEFARPSQYIDQEDRYPESSWKALTVTSPVIITGEEGGLQPSVTIESAKPRLDTAGILDRVWGKPGVEVTIYVRNSRITDLTVRIENQESTATLLLRDPIQLIAEYGTIGGVIGQPYPADSLTYRVQLPNNSPDVKITSQRSSLVLNLTISSKQVFDYLPQNGIPITAIDFLRQNSKGDRETTLVESGEITYPDFPKIEKISLNASDFIGLDGLEKFYIEQIIIDPKHVGVRFRLNGIAGKIGSGSQEFSKDHRLTRFDSIWENSRLSIFFSIIVWVFSTTIGAYRFYKNTRGD